MSRIVTVGAAQMGPIQRQHTRADAVERLVALLENGARSGCDLVVFPELALTTFFPRWFVDDISEADHWYEREMPSRDTKPLFDAAKKLKIGFSLGYAELTEDGRRFNTQILVERDGSIVGRYHKVHIPGHEHHEPDRPFQHAERYYFEPSPEGFPVWRAFGGIVGMMICNDRRWPEAWRTLALRGAELVAIGYNSAAYDPNGGDSESAEQRTEHSQLAARANAYMNATWAVTVAKAGDEDGSGLIGGSCIVDPNGRIVAEAKGLGDEVIVADCDLDACRQGKEKMFNFAQHRRPQWYGPITSQIGAEPPA